MAVKYLFSFDNGGDTYITVLENNGVFDTIGPNFYDPGQPPYPTYAQGDEVVTPTCDGTTKISYLFQTDSPYVFIKKDYFSAYCGYNPPVCDLALFSISHTDQSTPGVNDGTITAVYTSSKAPLLYNLDGVVNNTGYFTGLAPGVYNLSVIDNIGCVQNTTVEILAVSSNITREKYRLAWFSLKDNIGYQLRFLDQKKVYDPAFYPIYLTGTDSPVIYKKTNSNEDKTNAILVSSLEINLINNGVFNIDEFADAQERDWKLELYRQSLAPLNPVSFNATLTEQISPTFIDGNVQLKSGNIVLYRGVSTGTYTATIQPGKPYSIEAFVELSNTATNPKIRMTISRGGNVIYDRQIPSIVGASMVKTGIAQDTTYTITVVTLDTTSVVPYIDIEDNEDATYLLEWQGWSLPDEVQDLYKDENYPVKLYGTDGLLSLKGSTFGDQSLFYLNQQGVPQLIQLFGLKTWAYLIKICLGQLGYGYTDVTICSSLIYDTYRFQQWLNISVWADLFYDENNIPKDTYSSLEILLKGLKLQIIQHKGTFVLFDINDLYYRGGSANLQRYTYQTNLIDTIVNGNLCEVNYVGFKQSIQPINPDQSKNYDKAFNQIEAQSDFNLLSLLYPNPSFELNAVEGQLPTGLSETANMNAFSHYDPQNPLNPTIGAYSGDWEMRTIGRVLLLMDGFSPATQGSTGCYFSRDGTRAVHATNAFVIDQPNKKASVSFYWRPIKFSDTKNPCPRYSIFYQDGTSGNTYMYTPYSKNEYNGTGWFHPDHDNCFIPIGQRITDYNAWNNFSITTDKFPETGIGTLEISIGTPIESEIDSGVDPALDKTIDYDAWVMTISDANDPYNLQTGEKHIIKNITSYAKAEKKTLSLDLFSNQGNKRLSGNVGYGSDYSTSQFTNEWFFALSTEQTLDRLTANVARRFAKNYQRPMYKWQGSIFTETYDFYSIFILKGYENRVFVAFTIEMDLRNSTGNIVLIETDDTAMQSTYQYIPLYQKTARNNLS